MWIVKTLGRRTRNGIDRVYSVNGAYITQDLDDAADAAIDVFKDEVAGNVMLSAPRTVGKPAPRLHDLPEYWNGTLTSEQVRAIA